MHARLIVSTMRARSRVRPAPPCTLPCGRMRCAVYRVAACAAHANWPLHGRNMGAAMHGVGGTHTTTAAEPNALPGANRAQGADAIEDPAGHRKRLSLSHTSEPTWGGAGGANVDLLKYVSPNRLRPPLEALALPHGHINTRIQELWGPGAAIGELRALRRTVAIRACSRMEARRPPPRRRQTIVMD
jgi:hypothetical protein